MNFDAIFGNLHLFFGGFNKPNYEKIAERVGYTLQLSYNRMTQYLVYY